MESCVPFHPKGARRRRRGWRSPGVAGFRENPSVAHQRQSQVCDAVAQANSRRSGHVLGVEETGSASPDQLVLQNTVVGLARRGVLELAAAARQ